MGTEAFRYPVFHPALSYLLSCQMLQDSCPHLLRKCRKFSIYFLQIEHSIICLAVLQNFPQFILYPPIGILMYWWVDWVPAVMWHCFFSVTCRWKGRFFSIFKIINADKNLDIEVGVTYFEGDRSIKRLVKDWSKGYLNSKLTGFAIHTMRQRNERSLRITSKQNENWSYRELNCKCKSMLLDESYNVTVRTNLSLLFPFFFLFAFSISENAKNIEKGCKYY